MEREATQEIPRRIAALLKTHNLSVITHPAGSTATAEMAARQLSHALTEPIELGQIANTLLWIRCADCSPLLLIIGGDKKVSTGKLKRVVASKVRLATEAEIVQHLGTRRGAVSPFVAHSLVILIEPSLARYDYIYPAAGTDCSSVKVTYRQLIAICHAEEALFAQ